MFGKKYYELSVFGYLKELEDMNIPMNIYFWLLCTIPIILLIVLLIGVQWSALRAASLTLVVTIVVSVIFFEQILL